MSREACLVRGGGADHFFGEEEIGHWDLRWPTRYMLQIEKFLQIKQSRCK